MKKLLVVLVLLSSPVFAVKEYYSLTKSIRSLGMGGAFMGMSDDEYALFYNPAGLSLRQDSFELMVRTNAHASSSTISALETFKNLSGSNVKSLVDTLNEYQGKPLYADVGLLPYFLMKNWALGVLIADTKMDFHVIRGLPTDLAGLAATDPNAQIADLTVISDSGLVLGYAQSLIDPNLHVGLNLKGLLRAGGRRGFTASEYITPGQKLNIDPKTIGGSGLGIDLDAGLTYEMDSLPFGVVSRASLVFSNLLASDFSTSRQGGVPPRLTRTANLGWYTAFEGWGFVDNFHVLADITDISLGGETNPELGARGGAFFKKVHVGLEMPIGRLSLRTGLNQGYVTAGIGLNLSFLKLDLATYGEETAEDPTQQSRRYALTLAFGWGSGPAEPMVAKEPIREKIEKPDKAPAKEPAKNSSEIKK
ncbi:MAG: hypothetical protein EBQ85_10050 [Proteobacteria bacterium]|nr:hypothetical protein [Pseudomonadota bacterium]